MSGFSQVDIELGYSKTLTLTIFMVHVSAVIALAMTDFTLVAILPLFSLIVLSYHFTLKGFLSNKQQIKSLHCFPDDREWYAQDYNNHTFIITKLCHYSILSGWLLMKLEDDQGRRHWVVVPKDAVETDTFRRLNVLLLFHLPLQHPASRSSEV